MKLKSAEILRWVTLALIILFIVWYYFLAPCDVLVQTFPFFPTLNRCIVR